MLWIFFAESVAQATVVDATIVNLISALGSSGAAVAVLWICKKLVEDISAKHQEQMAELLDRQQSQMAQLVERQQEQTAGIVSQLTDLAKDKGLVIRENTVVMRENAVALTKLEGSIDQLSHSVERIGETKA